MNIADMNERITFQLHDVTPDQYGNHVETWTDYYTCSARAATFAKAEAGGVVSLDEREIVFTVRYCSELTWLSSDSYRVIFHNQIYNIESVDPMNWDRKTIQIRCEKEQRVAAAGGSNADQN